MSSWPVVQDDQGDPIYLWGLYRHEIDELRKLLVMASYEFREVGSALEFEATGRALELLAILNGMDKTTEGDKELLKLSDLVDRL